MGCFSTCFRKSKRRRSRRPTKATPCFDQFRVKRIEAVQFQPTEVKEQESTEILINRTPDSIDVEKEKLNISERKKETFDLNLKVYEELLAGDENKTFDLNLKVYEELLAGDENNGDLLAERSNEEEEEEGEEEEIKPIKEKLSLRPSESSSSSSLISFPHSTYRYQNCRDSDDEFDVVSEDESDIDYLGDDEDDAGEIEVNNDPVLVRGNQLSESLSSLSMDSWKQNVATDDMDMDMDMDLDLDNDAKMIGLSEDGADGISSFDSVLHPVENLTQWKVIKARAKLEPQNKAKENKISGQECDIPFFEESILKPTLKSDNVKNSHQEIAVDASLSTWLAGPEAATPTKSKTSSVSVGNSPCSERTVSPKDFEDRPILGALTVEEIREFSATSTPRRSPSRSPDDMPIIGSVGSYWSHSGQGSKPGPSSSTRSRYMEGRKANSKSSRIPFEKRLERAALQKKGTVRA